MYSAGTCAECLGFFSPIEVGTIQGDPWLLVWFKGAFTIHKPSLPNQFSCLKWSDSWVVIKYCINNNNDDNNNNNNACFYLRFNSSHAKNTYPGFKESCI